MKLSKREVQRCLAALAIAVEWETSLMDAVKHCRDGEYQNCKRRREKYRVTERTLGLRYRTTWKRPVADGEEK